MLEVQIMLAVSSLHLTKEPCSSMLLSVHTVAGFEMCGSASNLCSWTKAALKIQDLNLLEFFYISPLV